MNAVPAPVEQPIPPDQVFTPGIREDISHEDYLAIDAFSSSGGKRLLQSPMHFHYDRTHPEDSASDSKRMGSALHMGILEPDRFDSGAVVIRPADAPARPGARLVNAKNPSADTLARVAWWEDFDASSAGRIVLTEDQAAKVRGMVDSVRRHPLYEDLFLGDGESEVTYQWTDARHGDAVPCKARYDRRQRSGLIVDIKSCTDASSDGFARAVAAYRYHLQEAHYRNGFEHLHGHSPEGFLFMAVENIAPYGCQLHANRPNAVMFALDQIERAMLLYAQGRRSGYWRGYPETVQPLVLPRRALSIPTPEYGNF